MLHLVLTCGVILLLAIGALHDLATRTIPNWISLLILPLALALRGTQGLASIPVSLAAAAAVLIVLAALHAMGLLGGGDVKLAAALAVALSPLQTLHFIEATAILGGLLGALYLLLARLLPRRAIVRGRRLPLRILAVEANRIRRRASLPYGIALALAGTLILSGA